MAGLTLRDVFDLPPTIPCCIVKIQDFTDAKEANPDKRTIRLALR